MGLFSDLFSTQPAQDAAAAKIAGLNTANTNAGADLTAGQVGADALYGKAQGAFGGLAASTQKGSDAYGDASGANGPEGLARAKANYTSDPGYSGGLTTGIDQLDRTAAMRGDLGGGNTSADTIKFASDYDANKYGNFVSGLAPYLGANSTAVAGQAGSFGAQAGADLGVAGQKATNSYNTASGVGNANADAAMAPYTASQNFWSSLMGGANMALKASGIGGYAPTPSLAH
jgi:hypothetical protein